MMSSGVANWIYHSILNWPKIKESLEIKRLKCDSSKSNINRDDDSFAKNKYMDTFAEKYWRN